MTNLIGLNIATEHVEDWGACKALVQTLNAGLHVAHFANPDQFEKRALELKTVSPQSLIICRPWHEKEREYHWPHSDPSRRYVAEPVDLLNVYGHMGKQGCAVELWCDVDGGKYPERLAASWREAIRLADQRGVLLGGPGYATGNPPLPTENTWTLFHDEILRMFSGSGHILTLHEYGPSTEWEVGRFIKWVIERCDALNLKVPLIGVTETGLESPHWRARGITQEDYAQQVIEWAKTWYQPYPNVIGAALFNYGPLQPREGYNLEGAKAFFATLIPRNPQRATVAPPPVVETPKPPVPPVKPEVQWPAGVNSGELVVMSQPLALLAEPRLNAPEVGQLRVGETVMRLKDGLRLVDGRKFYPVMRTGLTPNESDRGWIIYASGATGVLTPPTLTYRLEVTIQATEDEKVMIERLLPKLLGTMSIVAVPQPPTR